MPTVTVELNADRDTVRLPILWRLAKLFNVVTNIRRARVTDEYGHLVVTLEGTTGEVEGAQQYLQALNVWKGGSGKSPAKGPVAAPEQDVLIPNTITVCLRPAQPEQAHAPLLYRAGREFAIVTNVVSAAFDEEEGGTVEVLLSGPLIDVQRAIAYLHTTGIHVNPLQRSVSDAGNL